MDEILARLERIEGRLDKLEGQFVRPPVVSRPLTPSPSPLPEGRGGAATPQEILSPRPPLHNEPLGEGEGDLESLIGARWLPRAGAVAVIAGIAYLVGLGLQRGVITPATVAMAVALVCAAVALFGARMRDERAAFGNVLVGLGAGGLYVDAVGANLYQGMLGGEATVATCVAISLATLGYGARRALPSFLGVGLFGGILAALMPLSKGGAAAACVLLLLVTTPTLAVAAHRRWPMAAALAWGAAFLASLAPLYGFGHDPALPLGTTAALFVIGVAAWAWATDALPESDPQGAFPFAAALATGWAMLGALHGPVGAALTAAVGLIAGGIGLALRSRIGGRRVAAAGVGLALVIAPLGLGAYAGAATLGGLSVVGSLVALVMRASPRLRADHGAKRTIRALVAGQASLAVAVYGGRVLLAWSEGTMPAPGEETGLVVLLLASTVAAAGLVGRSEGRLAAGVVVWGLATRLALLVLSIPGGAAVTVAWIVTFVGLLGVGFVRRLPELRRLALAVAAATVGKVALVDLAGQDPALKAAALLGLGLVLLGGGYAYVRRGADSSRPSPPAPSPPEGRGER